MYKKAWWINPVGIYAILMCLVMLAYRTTAFQYSSVYGMQKGIMGRHVVLYLVAFFLFVLGYILSGKFRLKGNSFAGLNEEFVNTDSVFRTYRFLTIICILAYIIWYANFIRINGLSILSNFRSLASISSVMYVLRNNAGHISGITTFTEVGIVSLPLGVYLLYKIDDIHRKQVIKRDMIVIILLALFRTIAFSERLAIIELIVPAAVVVFAMTKNKKLRPVIFWGPVVAIVLLILIFAAFEYSRSWLTFYSSYYDSYFKFIIQRVTGYYTNAINTECLYIQHASTSILPYRTIEWLWELPGFSSLYKFITPSNASEAFKSILNSYGNPEYNNPGGLLATYIDFGIFFPIIQISLGFFVGRVYRHFLDGNLMGIIMYAFSFFALIEMPRYFSFGSTRAFFVYVAVFILYYICQKTYHDTQGRSIRIELRE